MTRGISMSRTMQRQQATQQFGRVVILRHYQQFVPADLSREVCILAGGLSSRMGRDKSRVRLAGRTLLSCVRAQAEATGWPVRIIRRDLTPMCGPLGGIFTALASTRADLLI